MRAWACAMWNETGRPVSCPFEVKVGRRYTAGGVKRSYVAARCSDHILRSHGIFTFANGLVIEGVGLEKYCAQR